MGESFNSLPKGKTLRMNSGHAASNGLLSGPSDHEKKNISEVLQKCGEMNANQQVVTEPQKLTLQAQEDQGSTHRCSTGGWWDRADARGQCSLHAPTIRLQTKGIYSGWGRLQAVIIRAKNQYPFTPDSQGMPARGCQRPVKWHGSALFV